MSNPVRSHQILSAFNRSPHRVAPPFVGGYAANDFYCAWAEVVATLFKSRRGRESRIAGLSRADGFTAGFAAGFAAALAA